MSGPTARLVKQSSCQNSTPKDAIVKIPHLFQREEGREHSGKGYRGDRHAMVSMYLPKGGYERLQRKWGTFSRALRGGIAMVAAIVWKSCKVRKKNALPVMRLTRNAAKRFVDRVPNFANATTFIADAWECSQVTRGSNSNGNVTNEWQIPKWYDGQCEEIEIRLTNRQLRLWERRDEIIQRCLEEHNPELAIVRATLAVTTPGPNFETLTAPLQRQGEKRAVRNYLAKPEQTNVTRNGDIQSNVSRLPPVARNALVIEGHPVVQLDIAAAHPCLLWMFYNGEAGPEWEAERKHFEKVAADGFLVFYGEGKGRRQRKRKFLAALNQRTNVARNASEGYAALENLFPLLAAKLARIKHSNPLSVGNILRHRLAVIMRSLVAKNSADGIPTIPVTDAAIVPTPPDLREAHRAEFRTAWRLNEGIRESSAASPDITCDGSPLYRFHFG